MAEMFAGLKPEVAFLRLPITPPTVTLLTEKGPYADLIDYGQSLIRIAQDEMKSSANDQLSITARQITGEIDSVSYNFV